VSGDAALPPEVVTFTTDIKPLFRERDRAAMKRAFDLWSYDDVRAHAEAIATHLRDGTMPCDGPWPAERVALFVRWLSEGTPA
jgi:acyl-CoA synthetase (AMP-forming)/AMP-acid ligase II